jgi:hypothetical protein
MGRAAKQSRHRKHTPLTSQAETGLYGAAYGAKKKGKPVPSYVPEGIAHLSKSVLRMHLKEKGSKKLPYHVKRRSK